MRLRQERRGFVRLQADANYAVHHVVDHQRCSIEDDRLLLRWVHGEGGVMDVETSQRLGGVGVVGLGPHVSAQRPIEQVGESVAVLEHGGPACREDVDRGHCN